MYKFNLIPSGNDSRDFLYRSIKAVDEKLPTSFSNKIPLVFDQGKAGTCGWNAITYAMMTDNSKYNDTKVLSRLYGYAQTKKTDGISDEGIRIRDGLDVAIKKGTCLEKMYPYSDSEDIIKLKFPEMTPAMETDALANKALAYARLYSVKDCKAAIAKEGGVIIAALVTDQFLWAGKNKGAIGRPLGSILGGHAMFLSGYDDTKKVSVTYQYNDGTKDTIEYTGAFFGPNSYGTSWGDNGMFYIPYDCFDIEKNEPFVFNLIAEAWTITEVPKAVQPSKEIVLKIGSTKATIGGKEVTLDTPPVIQNGRTMVPLRFIGEAFNKEVVFDNKLRTITIK